jgi:hypothetical protein
MAKKSKDQFTYRLPGLSSRENYEGYGSFKKHVSDHFNPGLEESTKPSGFNQGYADIFSTMGSADMGSITGAGGGAGPEEFLGTTGSGDSLGALETGNTGVPELTSDPSSGGDNDPPKKQGSKKEDDAKAEMNAVLAGTGPETSNVTGSLGKRKLV